MWYLIVHPDHIHHAPPGLTGRGSLNDLSCMCVCPGDWTDFSEVPGSIFFKLGTLMKYHKGLMHAKQILALCQNKAIMEFCFLSLCINPLTDYFHILYSERLQQGLGTCQIQFDYVVKYGNYGCFSFNFDIFLS